jgi:anaerobic selenocysteine-containing dehydrogenase
MSKLDHLMNKLLNDRNFAAALVADPDGTLRANGVEPTPEMVAALQGLEPAAVERLANAFGKSAAAA